MFPILFEVGPVKFYTYTIFMVVAFFTGVYVFWRKGREEHYQEDELFDALLKALFWGIIWSRVGFVVLHIDFFGIQPLNWINIFDFPGFSALFGILAGGWSLFKSARRQKWDEYEILDFGVLGLTFAIAVLWLGSFFSGAEVGTATTLPWGVQFPNVFDRRHPLQLYGFVAYLLLFIYLFWAESRYRTFSWYRAHKDSAESGFLFCIFCIFWGLIGTVLWFFSPTQVSFYGVPVEPVIRLAIVFFGCIKLFQRSGRTFSLRRQKH